MTLITNVPGFIMLSSFIKTLTQIGKSIDTKSVFVLKGDKTESYLLLSFKTKLSTKLMAYTCVWVSDFNFFTR